MQHGWSGEPGVARSAPPIEIELDELRRYLVGLARALGRGRVDPEDLAQDVFERWLRAAPGLPALISARAWLAVVLRRLLYDRLRRQRVAGAAVTACAAIAEAGDVAAPWWRDLDVEVVKREVAALSPPLRDAFWLFTFEAHSYEQIARRLRIAEGTVGVRISRARAALRRRLTARCAG
jgi:RNA polymerase sigma factor (sigma-70 family)